MSHTNSTTNYGLPQFISTDKPAWMVDVNGAMQTIDSTMHTNATNIATETGKVAALESLTNDYLPTTGNVGDVLTKTATGAEFAAPAVETSIIQGSTTPVAGGAVYDAINGTGGLDERIDALETLEEVVTDNGWYCKKFKNGTYEAYKKIDVAWPSGTGFLGGYFHVSNNYTLPSFNQSVECTTATPNAAQLCMIAGSAISGNNIKLYIYNAASGADHTNIGINIFGTY